MRNEALLLNGVYRSVIEDILRIQEPLPEQVLYLQPHSGRAMAHLRENPPSLDDPMRVFLTTEDNLQQVEFQGEVVGWDDKTELEKGNARRNAIARIIWTLQPSEPGLFDYSNTESPSRNLLHVRRMERLKEPFSVNRLTKTSDDEPMSTERTTPGGWIYVYNRVDREDA